jgi:hypothetical protein
MNEAFINGFLKRAADYGVSENEAISILNEKSAAPIGPILGGLGRVGNIANKAFPGLGASLRAGLGAERGVASPLTSGLTPPSVGQSIRNTGIPALWGAGATLAGTSHAIPAVGREINNFVADKARNIGNTVGDYFQKRNDNVGGALNSAAHNTDITP